MAEPGLELRVNRDLVQGHVYRPMLSPSALHTAALLSGHLWGPDTSDALTLGWNILQDHCKDQAIFCLGTDSVVWNTRLCAHVIVHGLMDTIGYGEQEALTPGPGVLIIVIIHGADGLDWRPAEALLCLSLGLWQVNLLRAGGTNPWDVSPRRGSQWVQEGNAPSQVSW